MDHYRVLLIGPRRALLAVLRARGIPFAVWQETARYSIDDAEPLVTQPLWNTTAKLKALITAEFGGGRFTHVIAGGENAVYPAAVARRVLGARLSPATTALRCRDKLAMKEYLLRRAIPMTDFMAESDVRSPAEAFARLGTPLVRKQRKSSGGRGLSVIHREQDLVLKRDGRNLLERFVSAPEASIESFVNDGRIHFTSTTRYLENGRVNFVPSGFDEGLRAAMLDLNRRVIEALKIQWGMTHLEVYLGDDGLLFGEVGLRPPGGYIMNALQHVYGFDPWAALVAMELGEAFAFPKGASSYAGVEIFHPGPGRVRAIRGEDEVRAHAAVREFRVKVKVGDVIGARASVGQDVGHLLFGCATSAERDAVFGYMRGVFGIEVG